MKRFSVLIAYPRWMWETDDPQTFYHFVRANDPDTAVMKAKRAAARHNDMEDYTDFDELLVLAGHKKAIR